MAENEGYNQDEDSEIELSAEEYEQPEEIDQIEDDQRSDASEQEIIEADADNKLEDSSAAADRVTSPYMTKYERARILGTRALQISRNAPLMLEPGNETDPLTLAEIELREKKIPFIVRRYLPDGSYEDWKVEELIIE